MDRTYELNKIYIFLFPIMFLVWANISKETDDPKYRVAIPARANILRCDQRSCAGREGNCFQVCVVRVASVPHSLLQKSAKQIPRIIIPDVLHTTGFYYNFHMFGTPFLSFLRPSKHNFSTSPLFPPLISNI